MLQRLLGLPVLCCLCLAAEPLTPAERRLNTESFEYVWKTIHDKHWDLKGADWQAVHDELRPKIERAETRDQARAVLRDMLGRLHETHFAIIPAEVYDDINDRSGPSAEGDVGLDARVIDGHALVTAVDVGSSAAAAGVRPGWEIAKIGGEALAPVLAKAGEVYRNSTLAELILARAVTTRLKGDRGEKVRVEFLDGANRAVDLDLARARPRGESAQFGFLPTQYVWFESRKIDNTGYIRFNIFLDPARIMTRFAEAVQSCASCDGMVIDLRGNPGGIGMMAMGMAGWFIDQPDQRLGIMYMKDTALKFVVNPRLETFRGPLAILVDGTSASTSEIFAGGMKDLGRARIFGTRTAAAALPSVIERLPDGDGFQYAVANYISEGGKPLEGIGVI
ncbi:MAG: S41 family peptidase, partial [Pseudomonadota bacterium]